MSEKWNRFQEQVTTWQNKAIPSHERTPERAFTRAAEEVTELSEAVATFDGTPATQHEIAMEGVDVIIRMLGIIAIVGGNATELLDEKIGTMQRKYPADTINRQVQSGVPFDQAMRQHKEAWFKS